MDELTPSWFIHVDWTGAETSRRSVAERFKLEAPIGRGSSAEVWKAHDPLSGRDVAIKVLVHELARKPAHQARLRHEARAVSRLSHEHIVRVLDVGTLGAEVERATEGRLVAGSPFVAMELVRGGTLLPLVANARPWPELRRHLEAILSALAHAHARGVVHLDLKPSNILRRGEQVVLTDFGTAHIFREERALLGGTLAYAAPEQLVGDGRDMGPRSDLFAFACVAWELITGTTPFSDAGDGVARAFAAPGVFVPRMEVPGGVHEWLMGMLQTAVHRRTRSAAEARRTLPGAAPTPRGLPAEWRSKEAHWAPQLEFGLGLFGLGRVPFVGREAERERLWALAHEVVGGHGQQVEIIGPAGSGKARLADWLLMQLAEHDAAIVLRVDRSEHLHAALARHFGVEGLPRARAARRIAAEVGDHWSIRAATSDEDVGESFDPVALIEELARHRPVALWIDDGPDVRPLPQLRGSVLLLRTGTQATGPAEHSISLGPLKAEARDDLLTRILQLAPEPIEALASVHLPGAILAVVGSWSESGRLQERESRLVFTAAREHAQSAEPWRARLDGLCGRLGEGEVRALEVAALLGAGAEMSVWGLAAMDAETTPTLAALDRLTTEGLGRVEREKIFLQQEVEAALVERSGRRKRIYHRACAKALGQLSSVRRAKERQGRHLHAAGDWVRALPALEQGARARLRALDPRGALALLSLLQDAQSQVGVEIEASVREMLLRAACLRRVQPAEGRVLTKEAHRLARSLDSAPLIAEAAHQRGRVARTDGDYDRATRYLLEAMHAAEQADRMELRSDIHVDLISVLLAIGLHDRADAEFAVACEREWRRVARALLDVLGAKVARLGGRLEVARYRIEGALAALEKVRPRLLPKAWGEAGDIERARNALSVAASYYQKALEGHALLGAEAASVQLHLGLVLGEQGDWEGASTHLHGALGAWTAHGQQRAAMGWRLALAWAAARLGDWDACIGHAQECVPLPGAEWAELHAQTLLLCEDHPLARAAAEGIIQAAASPD